MVRYTCSCGQVKLVKRTDVAVTRKCTCGRKMKSLVIPDKEPRRLGRKPYANITTQVSVEVYDQCKAVAEERSINLSELFRRAILKELENEQ